MGSHNSSVCIWSLLDLNDYRERQVLPDCRFHEHIARADAIELTKELRFTERVQDPLKPWRSKLVYHYEANWVFPPGRNQFKAIYFEDPKDWKIRKSMGWAETHQLISVGK